MRRRLFALLPLFLLAACSSSNPVACPTGSRDLNGTCRVICGGPQDCLSNEQCHAVDKVCVPGGGLLDADIPDLGFRDADTNPDADEPDAPPEPDAGIKDADEPDAPPPIDAGDAGPQDEGFHDADPPDLAPDAEPIDLGPPDTGFMDAAEPIDAGFNRNYGVATMRNAGVDLDVVRPGNMNVFLRSIPTTASSNRPTWAPSATRLAFQTTRTEQGGNLIQQVEIYAENGTFVDAFDGREPDWSHDASESRIAAAGGDGSSVVIHPINIGLEQVFVENEPEQIAWDPSGALRIAFTAATGARRDLFVRDLVATRFRVVQNARTFVWVPGGNGITVVDSPGGVVCRIADARVGAMTVGVISTWISGINCEGTLVAWSPNGRQFAFVQQAQGQPSNIYVVSSNLPFGSSLQNLTPLIVNPSQPIRDLEWTPDGEYLAFSRVTGNGQADLQIEPIVDRALPVGSLAPQLGPGFFALRPVN